jgi:hypothetical protein
VTNSQKRTPEAPAQAAGYLFQLRYALYRALKRRMRDPTGSIGIERLDDLVIQAGDTVLQIDQLKHSSMTDTVFNDMSPGVWRTLGNWSRATIDGDFDLAILELAFVTTATVDQNSGICEGAAAGAL